jgi:hypothetical protein
MKIVSDKTAIWLTDGALPAGVAITSVSVAAPPLVTVPATAAFLDLDLAKPVGTGRVDLDGKYFQIDVVTGTTLELEGAAAGAAVGALGTLQVLQMDSTFKKACQSTVTLNGQDPDSVDLSDMCDSSTKLGDPKPPTVSFTGFVNSEDDGFKNLIRASLESPKTERVLLLLYPDGEYVCGPAEIGAISVSAARGQGLSYSGTATFTEVPTYSWALPA